MKRRRTKKKRKNFKKISKEPPCAENRHEGISQRVGRPIIYLDSEGRQGSATWWGSVRSETVSQVLDRPNLTWEHVDIPANTFFERAQDSDRPEIEFPVPKGMVLAGVLVTRTGPSGTVQKGINILTRSITPEERAYALTLGYKAPNPRMPKIRPPLSQGKALKVHNVT